MAASYAEAHAEQTVFLMLGFEELPAREHVQGARVRRRVVALIPVDADRVAVFAEGTGD